MFKYLLLILFFILPSLALKIEVIENKKSKNIDALIKSNNIFENIINMQVNVNILNTKSNEIVYNNDKKLSEIILEAKNINLLGVGFDYIISYNSFIAVNYKQILKNNKSLVNDYDWLKDNTNDWSDWSTHPNSILDKFSIFDISFNYNLDVKSSIKYNFITGYKIDNKNFKVYDGNYIYSTNNGFRDNKGSMDGLVSKYTEKYSTLYLGVSALKKINKYTFYTKFMYSPISSVRNQDTHYKRYFKNDNTFTNTKMYAFNTKLNYRINKQSSISLNYSYTKYLEAKGKTIRRYYEGATEAPAGSAWIYQGAGVKNIHNLLSLSFIKNF